MMQKQNDYLATVPFDLYELYLFHLVVKHRSFTRAAEVAGLTQSAMTRQMQGLETSLGLDLLERTTRSVRITPAGEFLFRESGRMIGDVESVLKRLREGYGGARKHVRVGVSRTIGLAYLPGFFHANLRKQPEVVCRVTSDASQTIVAGLQGNELDLGVMCVPFRLSSAVTVTHRFRDDFVLVIPESLKPPASLSRSRKLSDWIENQSWLLPDELSTTGQRLRRWFVANRWTITPAMELDSFDLIINLVSLGMGCSFVPVRALALYGQKRTIQRVNLRQRFSRELVVVARRQRRMPAHLEQFIENVLF